MSCLVSEGGYLVHIIFNHLFLLCNESYAVIFIEKFSIIAGNLFRVSFLSVCRFWQIALELGKFAAFPCGVAKEQFLQIMCTNPPYIKSADYKNFPNFFDNHAFNSST